MPNGLLRRLLAVPARSFHRAAPARTALRFSDRIDLLLEDPDRPPCYVEVKNVTTEREIGSEKFERYAIDSVEDALSKEAGIIMRAGQLYVRGGRSGEVQTQIDGVSVDNPIGGQTLSVSTLAVESVQAVTGGLVGVAALVAAFTYRNRSKPEREPPPAEGERRT